MDADYELEAELERRRKDGSLIKLKALVLLDESMAHLGRFTVNPELSLAQRIDLNTYLRKEAGIDKPEQGPAQVPFSININLPGQAPMVFTATPIDELPEQPAHIALKIPDFDANRDLIQEAEIDE